MAKNIEVTLTLDTKGYNKKLQKGFTAKHSGFWRF